MRLLVAYSYRNVFARKLTTVLTVTGVALVVFVFCAMLMLSSGLRRTLVDTGSDDNVIVIRKASQTEIQSILRLPDGGIIKADPAIAVDTGSRPLVSGEILVLISQPKRGSGKTSNVPVRGVPPIAAAVRPNISLVEGRMYQPGTSEIITGSKVARIFQGCGLGETIRFGSRDWTVVGVFEADGAGFESEVWGDYDQLSAAFERPIYSSLTARLRDRNDFEGMRTRLEADPRLAVEVKREKQYYEEQSSFTTTYINILGMVISVIFAMGATVGAMITMYASVANRTKEIGTLRALGFSRFTVLTAFLVESVLMAALGGAIGVAAASLLKLVEVSTTNWNTFAELAFKFDTTPGIIFGGMLFAVVMGIIGGFLPAVRASRLRIIDALRAK